MFKYITVRLIWIFIILFALLSFIFIVSRIVMIYAWSAHPPLMEVARPVIFQYKIWLKDIFTEWNWGYYTIYKRPVWKMLLPTIAVTLKINLIALAVYVPTGIILGIISALKKNSKTDKVISFVTLLLMSSPSFVFLLLLILLFSYQFSWLPPQYSSLQEDVVWGLKSLILPIIALSVLPIGNLTRIVRGELNEVLQSEYLLLARTKGLTKRQVVFRHALRNSLVPVLPMIVFNFVTVLTGSFLIERIYGIPGAARMFLNATRYPYFQYDMMIACAFVFSAFSFISLLFVDISYVLIDPRIKMGSKKNEV